MYTRSVFLYRRSGFWYLVAFFCTLVPVLGVHGIGHPQTCVYPDVCLGIAHVSGKVPLQGQGAWQIHNVSAPFRPTDCLGQKGQIHCVSARPLVSGEGLYQIHGQSLSTHRGKHRSGGAQENIRLKVLESTLLRTPPPPKGKHPNRVAKPLRS